MPNRIKDSSKELEELYRECFPERDLEERGVPERELSGPSPDISERIELARQAKNGERFIALYDAGDTSAYPSQSEADLALMQRLAFWFNGDADFMKRAFDESALGEREKWRNRPDYRERTVKAALKEWNGQGYKYRPKPNAEVLERVTTLDAWATQVHRWTGRNGPRNRYIFDALLCASHEQGALHPYGVSVTTSIRHLALTAGFSKHNAVTSGIRHLQELGVVRVLHRGRDGDTSNTYLLRLPDSARGYQLIPPVYETVHPMRSLLRRIRENGRQQSEKTRVVERQKGQHILYRVQKVVPPAPIVYGSVGKAGALLIERVLLAGKRATRRQMADAFGYHYPSDLMRRCGNKVVAAGLLGEDDDCLVIPDELEDRLEKYLEETGCNKAEEGQRRRYEGERQLQRKTTRRSK